jgi:hypothetical protein
LLQIQDEIQRDQDARRRQARRGDLDDLRRLQREIDTAADVAAKQALAVRIQTVAAKHWTDGEILSIANALLLRLGLVSDERSGASPRGKGATVILHVPRPSTPTPPQADASLMPPVNALPSAVPPAAVPTAVVAPSRVPRSIVRPKIAPSRNVPPTRTPTTLPAPQIPQAATVPTATSAPVAADTQPKPPTRSSSKILILVSSAAIILLAVLSFAFFARKHQAPPVAKAPAALPASTTSVATVSAPAVAAPAPAVTTPAQVLPEPPPPAAQPAPETAVRKVTPDNNPPPDSSRNVGMLLVIAGQDGAKVFLNGRLQRQLTQAGQLRLPNLEPRDYVVQVSKSGFQDPPQQKIHMQKGEQASLIFNLQPQPRLASLTVQGGVPGTSVLVDQTPVGNIQPDGTLSVSTVSPGDHTVELRKDRFKPRQFKKHFVAGAPISLAAADAALEAAPTELKIIFAPADASVAIVKGDFLKVVSSGVALNLAPGTYTLTARTADRFTRSSTFDVIAGQSKTLDLSLAPSGMSKWDDPASWKHEGDSFTRKGGDFVLYGAAPASGTFAFSAMLTKGRLLQWVLNYTDPKNYVLFQMDDNNFYRSVIHNGQKTDEIIVPHKGEKKSFRTLQVRVSSTEIIHEIKQGDRWTVLDRWTQPGVNLGQGKFGFYIPGNDQIAVSSFAHYADLNLR